MAGGSMIDCPDEALPVAGLMLLGVALSVFWLTVGVAIGFWLGAA